MIFYDKPDYLRFWFEDSMCFIAKKYRDSLKHNLNIILLIRKKVISFEIKQT